MISQVERRYLLQMKLCCSCICESKRSIALQQLGRQKRQKIRFWPKLSSHTHQFVEVVHDWVWKRFLPLLQSALSLQHCNPCLYCKYKYNTQSYHMQCWVCRGSPRYRESHELMQLRRGVCGKNLSREEGGGGKNLGKEFMQTSTKDMQQAQ